MGFFSEKELGSWVSSEGERIWKDLAGGKERDQNIFKFKNWVK